MWMPAAPARIISLTVRVTENALPQPVSASTSSGRSVAALTRRTSSSTSLQRGDAQVRPAVGRVRHAAAGQVQRPEPGRRRQHGAVGVDRRRRFARAARFPGRRAAAPRRKLAGGSFPCVGKVRLEPSKDKAEIPACRRSRRRRTQLTLRRSGAAGDSLRSDAFSRKTFRHPGRPPKIPVASRDLALCWPSEFSYQVTFLCPHGHHRHRRNQRPPAPRRRHRAAPTCRSRC